MTATATVDPTRLAEIVYLDVGEHNGPTPVYGACLVEAAAYVAGEPWSDDPDCVCPVIAAYARTLNDLMGGRSRQRLIPYIARIVGTVADRDTERRRAFLCADQVVRVLTPLTLDALGLSEDADRLRALPPVTDEATADIAIEAASAVADTLAPDVPKVVNVAIALVGDAEDEATRAAVSYAEANAIVVLGDDESGSAEALALLDAMIGA